MTKSTKSVDPALLIVCSARLKHSTVYSAPKDSIYRMIFAKLVIPLAKIAAMGAMSFAVSVILAFIKFLIPVYARFIVHQLWRDPKDSAWNLHRKPYVMSLPTKISHYNLSK